MKGKKAEEVKELTCGDIGAIGKMEKVKTGDTLCDPRKVMALTPIPFAEPSYSVAIVPKTRGQEDKIAQGLNRPVSTRRIPPSPSPTTPRPTRWCSTAPATCRWMCWSAS